ncbi:MAG: GGDEF domain-containing protein, partial [Alkalimonas sp.]|nr:GGDEF domain-containing protein [Alkalimonas sp.]
KMIDIEHFKEFNDHYGHAAGDKVLHQVATTLQHSLRRPNDFIARYGGEEFVILLPDSDEAGSRQVIQHCLTAVEQLQLSHGYSPVSDYITLSAGGISCSASQDKEPGEVLKRADEMLYQAKQQGKNRLVWCPQSV